MSARADYRRFSPEERASFLGWRFGSTLDWASRILVEVKYPVEELRWFVDAVQGICKGTEKRIAHETLARRAQRFKNKAQARELVKRAVELNAEWSRNRLLMIFDIERPRPGEMEGKEKRARTRYTDYLTAAAVWAQETQEKVRKSDELRWRKDDKYRVKKLREILDESLKMLPGFERVEDMPAGVQPKEKAPLSLSEYIQQRERIILAENKRILDCLLDGDLIDSDEISDRLAKLGAFETNALGEIRKSCASARAVLEGLRKNRLVRAMDFTDPEAVAAEIDSKLAKSPEEAAEGVPASGLAGWLEEVVNPADKGNAHVPLVDEAQTRDEAPAQAPGETLAPPTTGSTSHSPSSPPPLSATNDYKDNAGIPLSVGPGEPEKAEVSMALPNASEVVLPSLETMLDWALFWAGQGIRVFPLHEVYDEVCTCTCTKKCKHGVHKCGSECESKGKHPRTYNGLLNATAEPKQIREWWTKFPHANIGGVMGAPGNLLALDVDPKHGGDASFNDLIEVHGTDWLDTLTHRTGSGGFHLFFQYPLDIELRNSAGKVGPGLDTRGEGGYVVLPPSLHASGNCYQVMKVAVVRPVPDWLVAALREDESARVIDFQELKGRRTFASASGDPFHDGTRNVGLFGVGIGRWRHGWAGDVVELHAQMLEVNAARCIPPLDDAEVAEMAAHICKDYGHLKGVDAERKGAA